MDEDLLKVLLGFLGTALILGILVSLVGVGDLLAALGLLDVQAFVLIAAAGLAWLASWGLALRRVLRTLDIPVSTLDAFLLYASAAFANNVTPFGQAGGEPLSALLIARATGADYERGLAAIASVDSLNFVPSIAFALIGLGYYVARFTIDARLRFVVMIVVGLAAGIPVVSYLLWANRDRVQSVATTVLTAILGHVGRILPGLSVPESSSIRARIGNFYAAIGRIATGRGNLLVALAFSALGWLFVCLALWLSLWGIGYTVPLGIVFIVVPVGTIASVAPLPGGAGGVEAATVLLLVPTTGVSAATAGAAAIIFRGGTYWFPTLLGGVATAVLQGRTGV